MSRIYACIDLKSFYASVECAERNLDPLKTNLVVADESRTEKTICLAVSPSLKAYGLSGRSRLYEVNQKVKEINFERKKLNKYKEFYNSSSNIDELKNNTGLKFDFIIAKPRMGYYIKYSTKIYNIYLKYVSKDDIFPYSIDEVFIDITDYLKAYNMKPRELITKMIHDVYKETKITATSGIGTNMYLAKIAMDIVAKHCEADKYGVRIACLDEITYRKQLWNYKPITNFWRIGKGISKRLEDNKMYTMGDVARTSLNNEALLYKLFGVNAEILIDHAWGYEPCTIKDVKKYKPQNSSLSSGQVLSTPYNYNKSKLVLKEMADLLALSLTKKNLKTNQLVLTISYDTSNLYIIENYKGEISTDFYGRKIPKNAHGSINLEYYSSSSNTLMKYATTLFDKIINKNLLIRKINICANNVITKEKTLNKHSYKQYDLFSNIDEINNNIDNKLKEEEKDDNIQKVIVDIKNKYGKNAILKGMNLESGATAISRNKQIGGHSE